MEGIFLEFENENSLRSYPFAAGCVPTGDEESEIGAGVFVDAALYPVNPAGRLYLSEVSDKGVFSVSDNSGVIMTGSPSGSRVEFHDLSGLNRQTGILIASSAEALSDFAGRGVVRAYSADNTAFASGCVFPVVVDGVTSLSVAESRKVAGAVGFSNGPSDDVRVSSRELGDGRRTLRFDVLPRPEIADDASIRRIICVVDGQTPFRIEKTAYNVVMVRLGLGIDREVVCAAAHRENRYEMADTCDCEPRPLPAEEPIPEKYQLVEVYIPPDEHGTEGGVEEGADNAFYLVSPNILGGGGNPISITLEDGVVSPRTDEPKTVANGGQVELAEGELLDEVTSKGVVIQVPGLSGGAI